MGDYLKARCGNAAAGSGVTAIWRLARAVLVACPLAGAGAHAEDDMAAGYLNLPCMEIAGPVETAIRFVEEATGDRLTEVCVKSVPPETIRAVFRATAGIHERQPKIGGLFVVADETVLVPTTLDLGNAFDLSFLVHEITHYQQGRAGLLTEGAPLGGLECAAYLIQSSYLRSVGQRREALITSLQADLQAGSVSAY